MIRFLQNIVFRWTFVQEEIDYQIKLVRDFERTKTFALAQKDVLETMADDLDKRAEELAKTKLKEMLSPVDYTHVISRNIRTKQLMLGTAEMDAGQLGNLKSEAAFFKDSNLWKILIETPKELAQRAMFEEGDIKNFEKGRAMIFHLDSQQKIVDTLFTYQTVDKK